MSQVSTSNGPAADDDDTFERDLKEMLKEGPSLNDMSSTVQGGNPVGPGAPPASAMRAQPPHTPTTPGTGAQSRPHSLQQQPFSQTSSSIPLSSPERNGSDPVRGLSSPATSPAGGSAASKLEGIKAWTISTYKVTRQMVSEKLGRTSRTIDADLEAQIETLRETQRKYSHILRLARALSSHFQNVVNTQRQLGDAFCEMSQKNPELQNEFSYNAETQKVLCKNGETLLGAINYFISSVGTLSTKTIEDTMLTVTKYNQARVEYDAYRVERDTLQNSPRDASSMARLQEAEANYARNKERFDKLRGDVAIKLKFLDENKLAVTRKQLYLFDQAVRNYMSSNVGDIEALVEAVAALDTTNN